MDLDLDKLKHIHFVGIKGVGMTSLALCAQDMGITVTGSDISEVFITDKVLKERGINYKTSFSKDNLSPRPDLVVTTGAHGGLGNLEVVTAKDMNIPVLTQAEALAEFTTGKKLIAVCGVGGKTTTSSMIAFILEKTGFDPSYAVGVSEIFGLGYGGKYVKEGEYFVAEADEYVVSPGINNMPKFHLLSPQVIVVTNIYHDHPDIYPSLQESLNAYQKFFEKLPENGKLIISSEDTNSLSLAKKMGCEVIEYDTKELPSNLKLKIPGTYNLRNALAAIKAVKEIGIKEEDAARTLNAFSGLKRRFEVVGETSSGAVVVDDYAHHPDEIESVINAARNFYPEKKIAVAFQPHTYSRTKALFNEFAKALSLADKVCLVDIYASRREVKDESVSSQSLAAAVKKINPNTFYMGGLKESTKWLRENTMSDEVLLTVGAGDIFYIHDGLVIDNPIHKELVVNGVEP